MYLFIQKASPFSYLRDSSPRSQCLFSLSSLQIFQASLRALSTTIQSKVGIQVHNNKKNQQPCKTVTDDIHTKHNASTLALHLYRTFLNIVWRIVLLTFTKYLVTIHLHHWGVECDIGVYSFCLQLLIIHLLHILKSKVPLSKVPRWNFSPGFYNLSQKIASLIRFMFKVSTFVTRDQAQF